MLMVITTHRNFCCNASKLSLAPGCLQDLLPDDVPIISVSKGLEVGTGKMMSELIVDVFGRKHPAVFISGPSFAKEVMTLQPTGVVAASKVLTSSLHLLASLHNRINKDAAVLSSKTGASVPRSGQDSVM